MNFNNDKNIKEMELLDRQEHKGEESVLDRKEHVYNKIIDVPDVPPLCNSNKFLRKQYIEVSKGMKIYCEDEGDVQNEPIILFNGGPGGSHDNYHNYFSQLRDNYRVIYFDNIGTGKSSFDKTGKLYKVKYLIHDIETIRKYFHIKKWNVLGWSFGGFIAQVYTLKHPNKVNKLILVTTEPMVEGIKTVIRDKYITDNELCKLTILRRKELSFEKTMLNNIINGEWKRQMYYKPRKSEYGIYKYQWKPDENPSYNHLMGDDAYSGKYDLTGKFKNCKIPTLILDSEHDLSWGKNKIKLLKKNHSRASLVIFHKSAHDIFQCETHKFFYILRKFLEH
jgi:proline iminopeptidase